jgi:hypothetical protein
MLEILMAIVAAVMACDELLAGTDTEPVGIGLEGEGCPCILCRAEALAWLFPP